MAPDYRSQRRQNRTGYIDHDVFEGLPVRHWRREVVTVAPPPPNQENMAMQNDIWAVELPYGMPKDSHLLPQHCQDLLRAARSGRTAKRPAPVEEEEIDVEAILGDKSEKKEEDPRNTGFAAKAWKLIPRHMEGPDVEYLAKRRKGVVTMAQKPANTPAPVLTRTTVKKIDAAGNEYLQDVVVEQGQPVDGEVISQRVIKDPNAGALAGGLLAQQAPSKRKVPPPRKKSKGTGKSKKKKAAPPSALDANGVSQRTEGVAADENAVKTENKDDAVPEDTEMADGSMAASDDEEGEEGEEGEEEEEEEEEDDEGIPADKNVSPKPQPVSPAPENAPATEDASTAEQPDTTMADSATTVPARAEPPASITDEENTEAMAGSPVGNMAPTTSTLSPPPAESPVKTAPADEAQDAPATAEPPALDEATQQEALETTSMDLPHPPPEPTVADVTSAIEARQEEEEEEEILHDIVDNAENAKIGEATAPETSTPGANASEPAEDLPEKEAEPAAEPQVEEEKAQAAQLGEDDDLPDLLGGLEKQLNKPVEEQPDAL